jgi:hypothetical protein
MKTRDTLANVLSVQRCFYTLLNYWPHNRALQYLQQVQRNVLRGVLRVTHQTLYAIGE